MCAGGTADTATVTRPVQEVAAAWIGALINAGSSQEGPDAEGSRRFLLELAIDLLLKYGVGSRTRQVAPGVAPESERPTPMRWAAVFKQHLDTLCVSPDTFIRQKALQTVEDSSQVVEERDGLDGE